LDPLEMAYTFSASLVRPLRLFTREITSLKNLFCFAKKISPTSGLILILGD